MDASNTREALDAEDLAFDAGKEAGCLTEPVTTLEPGGDLCLLLLATPLDFLSGSLVGGALLTQS